MSVSLFFFRLVVCQYLIFYPYLQIHLVGFRSKYFEHEFS